MHRLIILFAQFITGKIYKNYDDELHEFGCKMPTSLNVVFFGVYMNFYRKTQILLMLMLLSIIFCLGCQQPSHVGPIILDFSMDWEDHDIGAVTFFTRLANNIPEDKRMLVYDVYQKYGSVSFEWANSQKNVLDILVKGAPIEWAPSFVQENIELVDKKLIYWRFDEVWYRANFQLYTISFPFKGKLNPDAKMYIDTGSGMEPVELDKNGVFDLMLPFSHLKTIAFVKIELVNEELSEDESGNVIKYKRINITNNTIEDITKSVYLQESSIYASIPSSEDKTEPEYSTIDDYMPPELPEPEINLGPTEDWFRIDKTKEPEIAGILSSKEAKPAEKPSKDKGKIPKESSEKTKEETAETPKEKKEDSVKEKPIVLPKRKGEPPKTLEKPVQIDVFLIFKGLEPGDKTYNLISNALRGFSFVRSHYDELQQAYIFKFRVYEISDIKRIHSELSKLSNKESLQMSNRSRYFGVKMTPLEYASELRTKITGHVLPNAIVKIFVSPKQPELIADVDDEGNFSSEIPLPAGTSFVYGKMIVNNETRYFQVAVLTGKLNEINKTQFDNAIKEITENFNKVKG
ncbi:MAG: hypothetical protein K8S87_09970 [Planctomycetes bacterium]|nr:hypothetical protein [Planctomycetota bacterium]